jgi:16S rRNA (adenine1518-N6/adenine1519-N6)-dimethyltransferase
MTTPETKRLIKQLGLKPDRAAGQHFLLDDQVVEQMADLAQVNERDTILEIGPGLGILTRALLRRGARVIAIELDRRLAGYLRATLGDQANLTLVEGDVFRVQIDQLVNDQQFKLVANLPYSATSGIFRQFLSTAPQPKSLTVLIQKEVAERIVAPPGAMSLLSLSVQYYGRPQKRLDVPPASFFPAPGVTSSVLSVDDIHPGDETADEMFRLARMAFAGRRKQLQNSLAAGLRLPTSAASDFLLKMGVAPEIRPQELSVENWLMLAKNIKKIGEK